MDRPAGFQAGVGIFVDQLPTDEYRL